MNKKSNLSGSKVMRFRLCQFTLSLAILLLGFSPQLLAVGTWTRLVNQAPVGITYTVLLSDGTVMGQDIGEPANNWYRLTPDIHGSYANGIWTRLAPMHDGRNAYATQVLTDGRVFVAGGESGGGRDSAEVYDPVLDSWTMCPGTGVLFSDSVSEILPNGNVLIAPVGPTNGGQTMIYVPTSNSWMAGPQLYQQYYQDEASWVKLPDNSILSIDPESTNSERYIPALNQWINDANVPVDIYGGIFEMGAALLLPDGNAFFLGAAGTTAIYIPSGTTNLGVWVSGPRIPIGQIFSDTPAAMMVNGKVLCIADAIAPANGFWEYDPFANAFVQTSAPDSITTGNPTNLRLLDLPDGNILFSGVGSQLYIYCPDGAALAMGRPTIISITTNYYGSYHITGKLLNGISEGAGYGDDAQMSSNYPLVRMTNSATGKVYYARTYNWSSTGVMTGTNIVSTDFMVPENLPAGTYSLVVTANGNSSLPVAFTFNPDPLNITKAAGFASSGPIGGPFNPVEQAYFLNNSGTNVLNWTLVNTSLWLNISDVGGTIVPGGQSTVIISLSSAVTNMPVGIYTATLVFTDLNSGAIHSIPFKLGIDPLLQNGGFEYGSLGGWALSANVINIGAIVGNYAGIGGIANSAHSGKYSMFLGNNISVGSLSQTLPTRPGQSYLLSLFVNSHSSFGSSNEFAISWNGTILFDQQNIATSGFTNLQFVVWATSAATELVISYVNATNFFILDDVSLSELPPSLSIASQPSSQVISTGANANLYVLVGGPTPFTYHWQHNGIGLTNGGDFAGTDTASLSISNATVADGGDFTVIVSSGFQSVTSQVAALTVVGIPLNCAVSPPSGLVSWWSGNATASDVLGTNSGLLQNGVTFVPGMVSYAFKLNGSNSYITAPDNPAWAFGTNAFTMELWANSASFSENQAMLAYDAGGGDQNKWIFWLNSNNLQLNINNPQIGGNYVTSTSFIRYTNRWYHIALTRQGPSFKFYLNGSPLSVVTAAIAIPIAGVPLTIGQAEGGFFFDGLLDEIRIYDRALTVGEIQAICQAGTNGMCAPTPLMFSGSPSFSQSNGVMLNATLRSGQSYHIEANTNIGTTNWIVLTNFIAGTTPVMNFTDRGAVNIPRQFYRIISP